MDNTTVGITIGFVTKGFETLSGNIQGLKSLAKMAGASRIELKSLNEQFKSMKNLKLNIDTNISKVKQGVNDLKSKWASALTFAVPVKVAMDYESALVDVKKYINFSSEANFINLSNEIKNLATKYGTDANELLEIAASGGQQGLDETQISRYTQLVTKFGVAFDMAGKEAGNASAYIMNNFKLGIGELEKLGNQINFLDDKMSMVVSKDIFNVLNRTAGSARILGLSADAASAFGASLLSAGKAPEVASTALNSLYNKLANIDGQDEKFHEALKSMGMDASLLKSVLAKDATQGVKMFLDAISEVDDKKKMGILTDFFGTGFADDMAVMVKNKDIYTNALNLIKQDSNGSLDEAMELKLSTSRSAYERFFQSIKMLGVDIGNAFLPIAEGIFNTISHIANLTRLTITSFPKMSSYVLGFGGAFLTIFTLAPVIKIIAFSFSVLKNYILFCSKAFGVFSRILSIVTLKNLVAAKSNVFLKASAMGAYLAEKAKNMAMALTTIRLQSAIIWTAIYNKSLKALSFVASGVSKAFKLLANGIKAVSIAMISNPLGLILGGIAIVAGLVIANWDKVKSWFISFVEWLKPYFAPIGQFLSDIFNSFFIWISGAFSWLNSAVSSVGEFFKSIFGGVVDFLSSTFGGFFDWIGNKFAWVGDITSKIGSVFSGVKSFLGFGSDENDNINNKLGISKDEFASFGNTLTIKPYTAQVGEYPLIASAYALGNMQTITNNHSASQNLQAINITFGNITANDFDKADFERYIKSYFRKEEQNARNRDVRD